MAGTSSVRGGSCDARHGARRRGVDRARCCGSGRWSRWRLGVPLAGRSRNDRDVSELQALLDEQWHTDRLPGAVALVARLGDGGDEPEFHIAVAGDRTIGADPITRDTLFRLASISKPIIAAATMVMIERGRLSLDEPVSRLLPELAEPSVLRRQDGPLDDVVPVVRPITVRHLLTFQGGHGLPADFTAPIMESLMGELHQGPPRPQEMPPPEEWMARLARTPLVHQPGEGWTYNTGADILGVLLARCENASLPEVLADTVLGPLGMTDTGFAASDTARLASSYRRRESGDTMGGAADRVEPGGFALVDPPDGQWASVPVFCSGAGGLVSTADDWARFGLMLLGGGEYRGRRVLSSDSVRLMMTSHAEAEPGNPFLEGQGWGFGGSVDLHAGQPWTAPGRYGWVGGLGTAGYVIPSKSVVTVWLSQVEMAGPDDFAGLAAFLTWAAGR